MNTENRLKLSLNVAVVSGIFCVLVALLLLLNFWQVSKTDPIESQALKVLVERLSQEPNDDALKQEIRNLDLLARKAYFNSEWQVNAGSYMLLFSAIIFALALRIFFSLKAKIEEPDLFVENELSARILSQKWLLISGAGFLLVALASSYLTVNHLDSFSVDEQKVAQAKIVVEPGVEVVEIGLQPTVVTNAADSSASVVVVDTAAVGAAGAVQNVPVSFPDAGQLRANSPSFRGPFAQGISYHKNIPTDFDGTTGKNILWQAKISLKGNNSPVIWGDKVFIAGASAAVREIYCYDRYGGKLLWSKPVDNVQGSPATAPKTTDDTGLSAPSLATDGIHVYGIFGNGDVIAFTLDGTRVWARNLGVPDNHYGHSSSLITWKDKLYVQYDTNKGRKLMALNISTGQTTWETERKVKISWASPILASIGGKYQVILAADPLVAGYDSETGKELWTSNCLSGEVGASCAFGEGLVFAVNEYAKLAAINPSNGQIVWEADEYLPEVASPVVSGGLLFVATSYGVLACYDAKTGEKFWENDSGVGYYSSPIVAENKLFIFDTNGKLEVFEVSKEKKLLAESNLGAKITSTPAFSTGRMYARSSTTLYCIGKK